ncbi:MAG: DNA-3-methyladenine glycosylase 2 family protein [Chloroflexi bacterium]|nr:DNA-3-methyladenine glycosylase 2 family protein [Chloroflexota bacterium]MBT6681169.1 DNA-3-methyladenine glycosylase 2 family protein [Chloroflexota bacterium]
MTPTDPAHFTLKPQPPYDFAANANFVTHYKGQEGADTFDGEILTRVLDLGTNVAKVDITSNGSTDDPALNITLSGQPIPAEIDTATRLVDRVVGARGNPQPFYDLVAEIPQLALLPETFHGLHLTQATSLFETITWAVLGQQISANVAASLRRKITEAYGRSGEIDGHPYALFPRPEDLASADIDDLRALGLSQRKAEYTLGLRDEFGSGRITEARLAAMDDEAVETELLKLRGIGPWTAHWLLIRGLGREDAFPIGDVALQKTLGELVTGELFTPKELVDYAEQFRPYRSYLTIYLFALIRARRVGAV